MAGLGSIGTTPNLFSYLGGSSAGTAESLLTSSPPIDVKAMRQGMLEDRLDQALSAAGVDDKTAEALKTDLQEAFETAKSDGTLDDPAAMQATIDDVFAEHGLDADKVLGMKFGPQALQEAVGAIGDGDDRRQTLMNLLSRMAKDGGSSADLSELLMDAVKGFDQTA